MAAFIELLACSSQLLPQPTKRYVASEINQNWDCNLRNYLWLNQSITWNSTDPFGELYVHQYLLRKQKDFLYITAHRYNIVKNLHNQSRAYADRPPHLVFKVKPFVCSTLLCQPFTKSQVTHIVVCILTHDVVKLWTTSNLCHRNLCYGLNDDGVIFQRMRNGKSELQTRNTNYYKYMLKSNIDFF